MTVRSRCRVSKPPRGPNCRVQKANEGEFSPMLRRSPQVGGANESVLQQFNSGCRWPDFLDLGLHLLFGVP